MTRVELGGELYGWRDDERDPAQWDRMSVQHGGGMLYFGEDGRTADYGPDRKLQRAVKRLVKAGLLTERRELASKHETPRSKATAWRTPERKQVRVLRLTPEGLSVRDTLHRTLTEQEEPKRSVHREPYTYDVHGEEVAPCT